MKKLGLLSALVLVACRASSEGDPSTANAEQRSTEPSFEYTCEARGGFAGLIGLPSTKVNIGKSQLSYVSEYGTNAGSFDKDYKAPSGKARVRYEGFETGEDCALTVVADAALLEGKPTGEVRLNCSGDGFLSDVLTCKNPKASTQQVGEDDAPPVEPTPVEPPDSARTWTCEPLAESRILEGEPVTMKVVDAAIRVDAQFEFTGTRDRNYVARSGKWMQFDNVEYGGDCSLTFVVEENALDAANTTTTLKARCAGDDFFEDRYTCTTK